MSKYFNMSIDLRQLRFQKEKYDSIYNLVSEIKNDFLETAEKEKIDPGTFRLYLGLNLAALFLASSSHHVVIDKQFKYIEDFEVLVDINMHPQCIKITCDIGFVNGNIYL